MFLSPHAARFSTHVERAAPPPSERRHAPVASWRGAAREPTAEPASVLSADPPLVETLDELIAASTSQLTISRSLMLQSRLANSPPDQRAALVRVLVPRVGELCETEGGAYLLQALIRAAAPTPFLTQQLARQLIGRTVALALDPLGFHVVRQLVFHLDADWPLTDRLILGELLGAAAELGGSPTGARVLRYALIRGFFAGAPKQRLLDALEPIAHVVACEQQGARLLRALLADSTGGGAELRPIVERLVAHASTLATDDWGAPTLRAILASPHATDETHARVLAALAPHALSLARDRTAHLMLQHCLLHAPSAGAGAALAAPLSASSSAASASAALLAQRERLAQVLIADGDALVKEPFGSCALQAALAHDVAGRAALLRRLIDRAVELARDRFGNHSLQHAIARAPRAEQRRACEALGACALELADDLHASFVLQRALAVCAPAEAAPLYEALSAAAATLARSRISSMVLQQLLRRLPDSQRAALAESQLLAHVPELMGNDHAVFVLTECAAFSPPIADAMRAELGRVERLIDAFAASAEGSLVLPLSMSAFQRKRAHIYVRRFGSALVSFSMGHGKSDRALHIFKAEGTRALPTHDAADDEPELHLGGRSVGRHSSEGPTLPADGAESSPR
jgi:hypothetical protein